MSAEPTRRPDNDVLARLTAIDHRLHQVSTHLAAVSQLLSQVDKIRANLETLIVSLQSTETIMVGSAYALPDCGDSRENSQRSSTVACTRRPVNSDG